MSSERAWIQHLRLLPGGDHDVAAGLFKTLLLYAILGVFAVVALAIFQVRLRGVSGWAILAMANALPVSVLAIWTAWRIHRSRPIRTDEVAVLGGQVWRGAEVFRVPSRAQVLSISPRRWSGTLRDGRAVTFAYRLDPDPQALPELGKKLALEARDLVGYVDDVLENYCSSLLPDPDGVREAAQNELLRVGVILTWVEVSGVRV